MGGRIRPHEDSTTSASITMASLVESVPVTPWAIHPKRDGVLTASAILVLSWGAILGVTWQAWHSLDDGIRRDLVRSSQAALLQVDGAAHAEAVASGRLSVADYDRMATSLTRLKALGDDYAFISTLVIAPQADGDRTCLVLEDNVSGAERDLDHDGVLTGAELVKRYEVEGRSGPDPAFTAILEDRAVANLSPYEDSCGVFLSAAAPVHQDGRVVGAVCVDINAAPFIARRNRLVMTALGFLAADMVLASMLGLLVYRTRRNERALAEQRYQVLRSLQRARDRALAGDKAKTSFLAMMSHELRTPLNGILGMAELLKLSDISADEKEMCGTIEQCGRHLLALVNDLLDFSAIETGRIDFHHLPFDPVEPLSSLLESITPTCESKALELILEADPALPARVIGDLDRIRQMLAPLVSNAVKFTAHGRIVLSVAAVSDGIAYTIRDTGPGINEAAQTRIFKPFQQGEDYLRRQHGGTGLGLAITGRLADKMKATVTSTIDQGTVFRVEVPLVASEPPRAWPVPGSSGTAIIRHADSVAAAVLRMDVACLGYQVIEDGVPDLLVVDLAKIEADGGSPARLLSQAGQVVLLMGLGRMIRDGDRFSDIGLLPVRKPTSRQQLAQAITRSTGGMTCIIKSIKTPRV